MHPEIVESLTQIASCWLDRKYDLRQEAIQTAAKEFCLSQPSFALVLDWIFSQWTESNIRQCEAAIRFKNKSFAVQVLAGNTPAIIAQGLLQGALLRIPQCIKIPSKQSTFARLLQHSFSDIDNRLLQLVELNTWEADLPTFYVKLAQADLVIAYGQDDTLQALKQYIAEDAVFVGHGHAESAAIIFKEAANLESLEKLAYDMLSYDQRGCLSPRIALIEEGGALNPAQSAKLFAEKILPVAATQLPRGGLFSGEAEEILHQRIVYGFRGQVYCGSDWTVCYMDTLIWPTGGLPRFLLFAPFNTIEELILELTEHQNHLISIGVSGLHANVARIQEKFDKRICALGDMQKQLLIF